MWFAGVALAGSICSADDYKYAFPAVGEVKVESGFWHSRIETNRLVTIPSNFKKCEIFLRLRLYLSIYKKAPSPARVFTKFGGQIKGG